MFLPVVSDRGNKCDNVSLDHSLAWRGLRLKFWDGLVCWMLLCIWILGGYRRFLSPPCLRYWGLCLQSLTRLSWGIGGWIIALTIYKLLKKTFIHVTTCSCLEIRQNPSCFMVLVRPCMFGAVVFRRTEFPDLYQGKEIGIRQTKSLRNHQHETFFLTLHTSCNPAIFKTLAR